MRHVLLKSEEPPMWSCELKLKIEQMWLDCDLCCEHVPWKECVRDCCSYVSWPHYLFFSVISFQMIHVHCSCSWSGAVEDTAERQEFMWPNDAFDVVSKLDGPEVHGRHEKGDAGDDHHGLGAGVVKETQKHIEQTMNQNIQYDRRLWYVIVEHRYNIYICDGDHSIPFKNEWKRLEGTINFVSLSLSLTVQRRQIWKTELYWVVMLSTNGPC